MSIAALKDEKLLLNLLVNASLFKKMGRAMLPTGSCTFYDCYNQDYVDHISYYPDDIGGIYDGVLISSSTSPERLDESKMVILPNTLTEQQVPAKEIRVFNIGIAEINPGWDE